MMISGVGCSLMDYLYNRVDFDSNNFRACASASPGDGGLTPGGLVFAEELERFTGRPLTEIVSALVGERDADAENLGGPAVVAVVLAAQLLFETGIDVRFFGVRGDDRTGERMLSILARVPLYQARFAVKPAATPSTIVLSDPDYYDGKGERTFINRLGAAGDFTLADLSDDFFAADIHLYGATALLPELHDNLLTALCESRRRGKVTVVATVYDFRNEKRAPDKPWPLGESVESYHYIDLLIVDLEEALKLSGQSTAADAAARFMAWGVGAVMITRGADSILLQAQSPLFSRLDLTELPVCAAADRDLQMRRQQAGDTTGCGDNFVGGTLAALALGLQSGRRPELPTLCAWGAAAGGLARFQFGGVFLEKRPGEKLACVKDYVRAYREQTGIEVPLFE